MMPKRSRPGCSLRVAANILLYVFSGSAVFVVPGWALDWELDLDLVQRVGEAAGREILAGGDGSRLREVLTGSDIDWSLTGRYIDQALRGIDWEMLGELDPYAKQVLDVLERDAANAPAADWLRQRLAYMSMAQHYVVQSRRGAAIPSPKPPASSPQPDTPPVRKPVKVPVHKSEWDVDTKEWLKRIPMEPPVRAQPLIPALKQIFQDEGIPPELVWLAEVESSFNSKARSPVGAVGLFQFMPKTAERFGLSLSPEDHRQDPSRSAKAAAQYLRILHRRFRDWPLALAAYNAGEGRVGRALRASNATDFAGIADVLPLETRMYVPRIAALVDRREKVDVRELPAPRL